MRRGARAWLAQLAVPLLCIAGQAANASDLPDILVNHDGLVNGVQDTSGAAGGTFTYRAKVKINGSGDASGVVLTQVLPVDAIYLSRSSQPNGIACSPNLPAGTVLTAQNNTFSCQIGSLSSADGFKWVDFNVVLPTIGSSWRATASAALPAPDGAIDGDGGNNNVALARNFTANDATDLGVTLTTNAPAGGVNNGDHYDYTIQVTNYGPTALPATGFAKVTFQVPAGAPVTSAAPLGGSGWTCTPAAGPVAANAIISCTFPAMGMPVGTYGNGQPLPPITIPVQAQMGGPIGAAVSVEGFQSGSTPQADGQKVNNTASLIVQSTGADYTDVSLSKTVAPLLADAAAGAVTRVTYTLTPRRENGALQPEQIVVTDHLPAGASFVAFDAGNSAHWACGHSAGVVTCQWAPAGVPDAPYTGANDTDFPVIKFTADLVAQPVGSTVVNEANVAVKPGTEPNTANNKAAATVTFNNTAQLSVTKSGPSAPVKKGVPFQYTLTIKNEGPMPIVAGSPISLTDTPSANLRLISVNAASSAGWTCSVPPAGIAGQAATCENSSALAVGSSLTLVLDAQVDTVGGSDYVTIANDAVAGPVPGRGGEVASGNATVTVSEEVADLTLTKVALSPPSNPQSGDAITYRITVTNKATSTQTAQNVKIIDALTNLLVANDGGPGNHPNGGFVSAVPMAAPPTYPAGFTYPAGTTAISCPAASATASADLTKTSADRNRNLTCTVDYLAVGASAYVDVTIRPRVTTASPTATTAVKYTNTASTYSTYIHDVTDDNSDSADIMMTSLVDLTVKKQVSPTTEVAAGQPASYTVTTQNLGPSAAQNVKMVDFLPSNAILVGEPVVPAGGTCTHSGGAGPMNGRQGGTMTCTWTTPLQSQQQYVVTYKARSVGGNPDAGATMDNKVVVSTDTQESNYLNNEADVSIALKPAQLDVQVEMSHTDDGLVLGQTTEYTITIKNDATSSSYATNVKLSELFPAAGSSATFSYQGGLNVTGGATSVPGYVTGVTGVSASLCGTQPALNATSGPLECTIPLMAPGDTVNIKFTLKAESLPSGAKNGTVFHSATVEPQETEYMPGYDALANNTTTDRTSTSASANGVDMGVEKQGPTAVLKAGDTAIYTITVTNYGQTVPAPAGTMTDTLPEGLTFVSASSTTAGATCVGTVGSSAPVVCQIPAGLAKGATIVYTVKALVSSPFTGSYPIVNKASVAVPGDSNPDNDKDEVANGNPPTVSGIPTLSEWSLALLSVLIALNVLRRRPWSTRTRN